MAQHRLTGATAFFSLLAALVLSTCGNADDTDSSAASSAEPSLAAHPGLSSYRSTRAQPELRLVTCGGPFDPSTGHYRDNLVAFAAQA